MRKLTDTHRYVWEANECVKNTEQGWRDGSVVQKVCCSISEIRVKVPELTSVCSHVPVAPPLRCLSLFSYLSGQLYICTHACSHAHTNALSHIINSKKGIQNRKTNEPNRPAMGMLKETDVIQIHPETGAPACPSDVFISTRIHPPEN